MNDRYLPPLRLFGGLLLLGLAATAWGSAPAAGVAIVAGGLPAVGMAVATVTRLPLPPVARRWTWLTAAASLALTACFRGPVADATVLWWVMETCALLTLLVPAVRRTKGRAGTIACALVYGAAVAVLPLRIGPYLTPPSTPAETGVLCLFWLLPAIGAAALGGYLRGQDDRRRRALADQRRRQRLEVARDLHDFASHDVMGVVVLVQAAQVLAQEDPRRAVELLPRIEEAGLHALAVMDRTVSMLNAREERDGEAAAIGSGAADGPTSSPGGASARPSGNVNEAPLPAEQPARMRDRRRDLSELPDLAARFTRTGTVPATLDVPVGVLEGLPAEVGSTGYRVVMESLTNIRRHAPAADGVRIAARRVPYGDGTALRLTVTDTAEAGADSEAHGSERAAPRAGRAHGGLGLSGLTDRVEALGGTLTAGPHGAAGWQVAATLPWPDGAVPSDTDTDTDTNTATATATDTETTGRPGRLAPVPPTAHEEARA